MFRDSLELVRGPRRRGGAKTTRVQNDAVEEGRIEARRRFAHIRGAYRGTKAVMPRSSSRLSSRSFALLIRRR